MADLRAALGHALEPAYRVEREVRPVGNCRMFVALEKSAGDSLLVKVLPGPLSLAVDSGRFEQEIARLGRRLQHPGLVAPRSAGRAGSLVYHTRTFVEGTTLRAWLARHGELPLRRAVEVLRDVLVALAHAHAEGVAHGDLKPENVLLADGQALVADAGILGALVQALTTDGGGAATATLCAADYLAPERRTGEPAPAPGDDMFAVGSSCTRCSRDGHQPATPSRSKRSARCRPGSPSWDAAVAPQSPTCAGRMPGPRWRAGAGRGGEPRPMRNAECGMRN